LIEVGQEVRRTSAVRQSEVFDKLAFGVTMRHSIHSAIASITLASTRHAQKDRYVRVGRDDCDADSWIRKAEMNPHSPTIFADKGAHEVPESMDQGQNRQ
ncbi:MAG: hypothetical protein KGJ47_10450, partial [Acidobacteriota bacterium]|nr:hypothetical protein [Acidobacteriota bacterium]